jgi:hypothetical protein
MVKSGIGTVGIEFIFLFIWSPSFIEQISISSQYSIINKGKFKHKKRR